jgi:hypothetical protein
MDVSVLAPGILRVVRAMNAIVLGWVKGCMYYLLWHFGGGGDVITHLSYLI